MTKEQRLIYDLQTVAEKHDECHFTQRVLHQAIDYIKKQQTDADVNSKAVVLPKVDSNYSL